VLIFLYFLKFSYWFIDVRLVAVVSGEVCLLKDFILFSVVSAALQGLVFLFEELSY
jgi:hypothetical protein